VNFTLKALPFILILSSILNLKKLILDPFGVTSNVMISKRTLSDGSDPFFFFKP